MVKTLPSNTKPSVTVKRGRNTPMAANCAPPGWSAAATVQPTVGSGDAECAEGAGDTMEPPPKRRKGEENVVVGQTSSEVSTFRPYGAHVLMDEFREQMPLILDYMLLHESDSTLGTNCTCGNGLIECLCNDCQHLKPCCRQCFIDAHLHNPWHWAQVWNGSYLERKEISCLVEGQGVVTIGHSRSDPNIVCPQYLFAKPSTVHLTVVHTNGIHDINAFYCLCAELGERARFGLLLQSRIFPATVRGAKIGFTFEVMRDFHLQTLTSKKSSYDYVAALQRKTNNACPEDVQNVYRQFVAAHRVWITAIALKRAGVPYGLPNHFPEREKDSVVVPCFACPERGFNVGDIEMDEAPDRFIHTVQTSMQGDGHFGLQRFKKVDDPDDVSLLAGKGFFDEDTVYRAYSNRVAGISDQKASCSNFNAIDMQNKLKFKGCVITGVVAIECGRHSTFLSMVDLYKGERFAHADYAVALALRRRARTSIEKQSFNAAKYFRRILMTYDVACQYQVHLKSRFEKAEELFPLSSIIDVMYLLVPKMHLMGHIERCRYMFSLNFFPGAGRTHGEGIETSWAETKQSGGSTRQMNHGHRHDKLTDYHNFWNWRKLELLGTHLKEHLDSARKELADQLEEFMNISRTMGKDLVALWTAMDDVHWVVFKKTSPTPEDERKWKSPYQMSLKKLPTRDEVLKSLEDIEKKTRDSTKSWLKKTPSVNWINLGIEIQEKQRQILRDISHHASLDDIDAARSSLSRDVERFRKLQLRDVPAMEVLVSLLQESEDPIEKEVLFLPSDLMRSTVQKRFHLKITPGSEMFIELRLQACAELEFKLRDGQANDAITLLCNVIIHAMFLKDNKDRHARGVILNLRSMKHIKTVVEKKHAHAGAYSHARRCILRLAGKDDDGEMPAYPKLKPEDLWAKNATLAVSLGDSSVKDSWIWTYGALKNMKDDERAEFLLEVKRVKWFRARASLMRWIEEVEILEAEFRRAITGCKTMKSFWNAVADKVPAGSGLKKALISSDAVRNSGYVSYAWQKAAMYEKMATGLSALFKGCGGGSPADGEDMWRFLERRRPRYEIDWDAEAAAPKEKTDELEKEIWEVYKQTAGSAREDPVV